MLDLILAININSTLLPQCKQPTYQVKPDVVGTAASPDTGETFYIEEYYYDYCAGNDLVLYKETDNALLTWKIISESEIRTAPRIEQFDPRHGEHIKTDWDNGKLVLQYKKNDKTQLKETELTLSKDQVIDAGFDQYVRDNWINLVNFESQEFDYASPPLQSNINLRIKRMDEDQCNSIAEDSGQHFCFVAEANNFLFRIFSTPIKLVYGPDKRLKKFHGVTNILDNNGNNYLAEITYRYLD